MNDEEMRIAAAECCGWHTVQQNPMYPHDRSKLAGFWREDTSALCGIANYLADLNACAEMEKYLKPGEYLEYITLLCKNTADKNDAVLTSFALLHATARQRCEAFLKVKGLWKL